MGQLGTATIGRRLLSLAALLAAGCAVAAQEPPVPADATAASLVGNWAQSDSECGRNAIREVIFRADGTFDVTWSPFESYVDYWGKYTFDPNSGALTLAPSGGNFVPADVAASRKVLVLAGDEFRFARGNFGTNPAFAACEAAFRRHRHAN